MATRFACARSQVVRSLAVTKRIVEEAIDDMAADNVRSAVSTRRVPLTSNASDCPAPSAVDCSDYSRCKVCGAPNHAASTGGRNDPRAVRCGSALPTARPDRPRRVLDCAERHSSLRRYYLRWRGLRVLCYATYPSLSTPCLTMPMCVSTGHTRAALCWDHRGDTCEGAQNAQFAGSAAAPQYESRLSTAPSVTA